MWFGKRFRLRTQENINQTVREKVVIYEIFLKRYNTCKQWNCVFMMYIMSTPLAVEILRDAIHTFFVALIGKWQLCSMTKQKNQQTKFNIDKAISKTTLQNPRMRQFTNILGSESNTK